MDGDGENSFSKFFMALFRKCTGCLSLEYSNIVILKCSVPMRTPCSIDIHFTTDVVLFKIELPFKIVWSIFSNHISINLCQE